MKKLLISALVLLVGSLLFTSCQTTVPQDQPQPSTTTVPQDTPYAK